MATLNTIKKEDFLKNFTDDDLFAMASFVWFYSKISDVRHSENPLSDKKSDKREVVNIAKSGEYRVSVDFVEDEFVRLIFKKTCMDSIEKSYTIIVRPDLCELHVMDKKPNPKYPQVKTYDNWSYCYSVAGGKMDKFITTENSSQNAEMVVKKKYVNPEANIMDGLFINVGLERYCNMMKNCKDMFFNALNVSPEDAKNLMLAYKF